MKVVFVTREGYHSAGARIRCYNFSKELTRYAIETKVLSFADNLGAKEGKEEASMPLSEKARLNYQALRILAKDKESIFFIQRFNYHSFAPYLVHFLNKNSIILDLDDWEMRENPKYYLGFYPSSKAHYFTRQIAKRSVFCIAASHFLQDFLSQFNKKVFYIPSGVDSELFKPSSNNLDAKEIVFSWIGTFNSNEYLENIKFALDCFCSLRKQYSDIYFDIVGDGIYRQEVAGMVNAAGDPHVRLKDWIAPDKIPDYLASIHIGLLPVVNDSKFNRAKSPTKLFEYMSMVKPTVSSNIGEAKYIIRDGENGFLAYNQSEFTERMQHLIEDARLRQRIGEKARETIERDYSLAVLGKRLFEALKTI